jgi:hypothetical protein
MTAPFIAEIDNMTTETGNGKKRERPSEEENVKTDEPLTKKPKIDARTCDICNPTHDPFLSMVLGGTLQQMKDAIPRKDDGEYGDPTSRLNAATCLAVEGDHAMKLAILLQEPALVKPDFHGMIQVACQRGVYHVLAVVLSDDRLYEDKYMTKIRWGGLFSDLFNELRQKNLRTCKEQLICLELLAEQHACWKVFESCMKGLKASMVRSVFDPNGRISADFPIGDQLPLYKVLEPWLL